MYIILHLRAVKNRTIYVLELADGHYYVGKTNNIDQRKQSHKSGSGSAWTKLHPYVSTVEEISGNDYDEDKYTLMYMGEYGIDKVRGGTYSKPVLTTDMINAINAQLRSANDQCMQCGSTQHWVKNCPSKLTSKTQWYTDKNGRRHKYIKSQKNIQVDDSIELQDISTTIDIPANVSTNMSTNTQQSHAEDREACIRAMTETYNAQPPHIRLCVAVTIICVFAVIMIISVVTTSRT